MQAKLLLERTEDAGPEGNGGFPWDGLPGIFVQPFMPIGVCLVTVVPF